LLEGVKLSEPEEIRVEEIVQEEEPECEPQEAELLGISLHALVGAPAPRTMLLMGRIKEQPMVILIDTGSTHNFVDQNLAKRIHLPARNCCGGQWENYSLSRVLYNSSLQLTRV
jgi:hypothetical protein